ncbi:MAG: Clp protease N-terminal domain-containing protein [Anaerolineae bacterium]
MTSYSRYSHHARRALTHASLLVTRYRHAAVDTGHLLGGLMLTEGSIAYQVLQELNLTFKRAEPHLRTLYTPVKPLPDEIVNNEALENTLALAADEATWLGNHYIGTEHLLLGITRTNAGSADNVLKRLDVDPEQVRRQIRRALTNGMTEYNLQAARRAARLSELSRRVINAAEQLSVTLDHPTVGLGHLLLVLLREKRSPISNLLFKSGLRQMRLRRGLKARDEVLLLSIEQSLTLAQETAESRGSHYTGTEHILLTLTTSAEGVDLLERYGADPEKIRQRIEALTQKKR